MGDQSKLEKIAIEQRNKLIAKNIYDDVDKSNNYDKTHTRALSDTITPIQGKGTGEQLSIAMKGGSDVDINGDPSIPGSGRIKQVASNKYSDPKQYVHPDTSLNIGQFIVP